MTGQEPQPSNVQCSGTYGSYDICLHTDQPAFTNPSSSNIYPSGGTSLLVQDVLLMVCCIVPVSSIMATLDPPVYISSPDIIGKSAN